MMCGTCGYPDGHQSGCPEEDPPAEMLEELSAEGDPLTVRQAILVDILAERDRQDAQWGGPEHDAAHSAEDWYGYRSKFESRALFGVRRPERMKDGQSVRDSLIKIGALVVAQLEALERKEGA